MGRIIIELGRSEQRNSVMANSEKEVEEQGGQTREQIVEERRRAKAEYGRLFDAVSEILFRLDPIGISFEKNTDEYEPEVETILPRLKTCDSALDARRVIHQEFLRWFDAEDTGEEDRYEEIAQEIWTAWRKSRGLS